MFFCVQHYCVNARAGYCFSSGNAGRSWRRRTKKVNGAAHKWVCVLIFKRREIKKRCDHSECFSLVIILFFARPVMSRFTDSEHLVALHSCILKWIKIKKNWLEKDIPKLTVPVVLNPDALNKEGIDLIGLMLNPNEAMYTHALNAFDNNYKYNL